MRLHALNELLRKLTQSECKKVSIFIEGMLAEKKLNQENIESIKSVPIITNSQQQPKG